MHVILIILLLCHCYTTGLVKTPEKNEEKTFLNGENIIAV